MNNFGLMSDLKQFCFYIFCEFKINNNLTNLCYNFVNIDKYAPNN